MQPVVRAVISLSQRPCPGELTYVADLSAIVRRNPTGSVYPPDHLEALAAVLRQHPNVLIVSDEIYEKITCVVVITHCSQYQNTPVRLTSARRRFMTCTGMTFLTLHLARSKECLNGTRRARQPS